MPFHKYEFEGSVKKLGIESLLIGAIWACESLHGEPLVRLNAVYELKIAERTLVIDSGTQVGEDLNKLFAGMMIREYGHRSFTVMRQSGEFTFTIEMVRESRKSDKPHMRLLDRIPPDQMRTDRRSPDFRKT